MKFNPKDAIFDQLSSEQLSQLLKIFEADEFKLYREVITESVERKYRTLARSPILTEEQRYEFIKIQSEMAALETFVLGFKGVLDTHIERAKEDKKSPVKKKKAYRAKQ